MYDNLFFDADGTLFDFISSEKWALARVFTQLNIKVDSEAFQTYSQINNAVWLEFEQNKITLDELKIERFRRLHAIYNLTEDSTLSATKYEEQLAQSFHLYDDTIPILKKLTKAGYPLTLITNGISAVQRGRLVATGTLHYFNTIVISEEIGFQKPSREYFQKALEMANHARNPLVIGDSLTSDIKGANNARLDACWINRYAMVNNTAIKAKFEITNLKQLLPILGL
ncbi:MAG: YjjG family noncanonical pyrimidine nucleotidase [Sphaerochaetaceae bacterium]